MTYQKALPPPTKATHQKHTSIPSQSPMQGQTATHPVLQLQRQIGNRAVGSLIQAKLKIGAIGDKYEREADRIATEVVQRLHSSQPQTLQRQEREDENELQMKSENIPKGDTQRISQPVMTKAESIAGDTATPEFEASINRAKGGGQPLSDMIRKPMEEALGGDFNRVRVHTDAQSDELNRSIQAKAFTTGPDIFFQQGAYNPASRGGQELIAHELTHVVQQSQGELVQRLTANGSHVLSHKWLPPTIIWKDPLTYDSAGGHSYGRHGISTKRTYHEHRVNRPGSTTSASGLFHSDAMHVSAMETAIDHLKSDSTNGTDPDVRQRHYLHNCGEVYTAAGGWQNVNYFVAVWKTLPSGYYNLLTMYPAV